MYSTLVTKKSTSGCTQLYHESLMSTPIQYNRGGGTTNHTVEYLKYRPPSLATQPQPTQSISHNYVVCFYPHTWGVLHNFPDIIQSANTVI